MELLTKFWTVFTTGSPNLWLLVILLPLAGMWIDRFWGADNRKLTAKLLTVATSIVAWCAAGPVAFLAVYCYALYRAASFKGGASAPTTANARLNAFKRHLLIIPAMLAPTLIPVLLNMENGFQWQRLALTVAIFAPYVWFAYRLAVEYGAALINAQISGVGLGKYNMLLERNRGGAFGVAFALWVVLVLTP